MTKQEEIQQCLDRIKALTAEPTKVEVGKVYRNEYNHVFMFTGFNHEGRMLGYGFGNAGEWMPLDDISWLSSDTFTPVPLSEWTELLDKERVKRGLVAGAKIERPEGLSVLPYVTTLKSVCFHYNEDSRSCYIGGKKIYQNGIWAKVIKDEDIYVNGEKVVFNDTTISIGNDAYSIKTLRFAHSLDRETFDKIVGRVG